MLKSYKYQIYPNSKQPLAPKKHFGYSLFELHWLLTLQNTTVLDLVSRYLALKFKLNSSRKKANLHG